MVVLEKSPWYNEIRARGVNEGKQVGRQEALLDTLEAKFGPLPEETTTKIRDIRDLERLHQLNRHAALATSLEEFLDELSRSNAAE